jgi:hypothetical protein
MSSLANLHSKPWSVEFFSVVLQADGQMDFDFMHHNNNECFCITNFWLYLNVELINKFTLFVATFYILNKEADKEVIL